MKKRARGVRLVLKLPRSKVPVCGGDGTWNVYKRVAPDVALHARCAQSVVKSLFGDNCGLCKTT